MRASLKELTDHADALKQQGRLQSAVKAYAKAARVYPASAVALHNLAATQGDLGRGAEAEATIRRAFRKGLNAPESWLVFARALLAQGKLEEAHDAFTKTLALNPDMLVARYELAQLIWMSTADATAAATPLDSEIERFPHKVELYGAKARIMMHTVGADEAFEFVANALGRWPEDGRLLGVGVNAATLVGKHTEALAWSERLVALWPGSVAARDLRMAALLAAGRTAEVVPIAQSVLEDDPDDQHGLAVLATAQRILGDDHSAELYDYESFVRPYQLQAPTGWSSLNDYLSDLAGALRARHPFRTHPFENSEENGSKIADILEMNDPIVNSFTEAIQPAIDDYLELLGAGADPLRRRNSGTWEIDGIWSVLLNPNGYHHNHVHPSGWISSACYIDLPSAVDAAGQEGWIKFGEPGLATDPVLEAQHAVKPEPGMLVLFPSYMWHGTNPFSGSDTRLTIAMDLVPQASKH